MADYRNGYIVSSDSQFRLSDKSKQLISESQQNGYTVADGHPSQVANIQYCHVFDFKS